MPNPHPFYRFKTSWNAGFYPDNQIVSNILNEVATALASWLPGYWPGKTIIDLNFAVKQFVSTYNQAPYLGELDVTIQKISDSPNWEYNINIFNQSLSTVDANQVVVINGFFNPTTKIVVSANVLPFSVGSYSGTFDEPSIPVEDSVQNSLTISYQYGSAIFPMVYSFDSTSGIATSGLARASNYQVDSSGNISRIPADTNPRRNARRFILPALSSNDKYVVTSLERIINLSMPDMYYANIQNIYDSIVEPEGWSKAFVYDSATYERIQITFSSGTRVFALVGRFDTTWKWQRFINDSGNDVNNAFLTNWSDTTTLPYSPLSGYWYTYLNVWYDFDFVDFTDGCYVSNEFYPMPLIPGDSINFTIPTDQGNITNLTNISIGLFNENGSFVQKIGSADAIDTFCPYEQFYASIIVPSVSDGCYRLGAYNEPDANCTLQFYYLIDAPTFMAQIAAYPLNYICFSIYNDTTSTYLTPYGTAVSSITTEEDLVNFANTIPGMTAFYSGAETHYFTFTWDYTVDCDATYAMRAFIGDVDFTIIDGLWTSGTMDCVCDTQYYLYSLSNIVKIDSSDCFSRMIEFWSDNQTLAQGFYYFSDWKQKIRIGLNGGGEKPVFEESLYRQSNGVHKRPQNKQDLSIDLHTDFFDLDTQLALTDATRHPYLVWNGQSIFVKGDIDVATIQDFTTQSSFETLSQMKFQALKQGFQPKNSSCLTC